MNKSKFKFFICIFAFILSIESFAAEINGAGGTLALPIIKIWISKYQTITSDKISYQGIGSANGIKNITAQAVDFAITDIGLTEAELLQDDLIQFPLLAGGITPVINLPGIRANELNLSGKILANIYLGKITYWDDASIAQINPSVKLEHIRIKPLYRKDGSGTSFTFTNYLSKVSDDWHNTLGIGSTLSWPSGEGKNGNDGISKSVLESEGAIGYVEYFYATNNKLTTVRLENADGKFIEPNYNNFMHAVQQAKWKRESFYDSLNQLSGPDSWPIIGISYVLIHTKNNVSNDAKQTLAFFDWVFSSGSSLAKDNNYISFTDPNLVKKIKSSWKLVQDTKGQEVYK